MTATSEPNTRRDNIILSTDNPIDRREEDLLGYWPFAEAVAKGLNERSPKDGFVVGLQAQWGMGKTSSANLLVQAISEFGNSKDNSNKALIRWFNPWQFSTLEVLAKGYFSLLDEVITEALGPNYVEKITKPIAKILDKSSDVAGHISSLGLIAATSGAALPIAGIAGKTIGSSFKLPNSLADSKSLEKISGEVRKKLNRIKGRIFLVLDDLDRLQPNQLIQVLTLVKSFGNLPQITHILIYDREIVNSLIREHGAAISDPTKPSFLEKIVQVEFDLPPPPRAGLAKLVEQQLSQIILEAEIPDDEYWGDFWRLAYNHYLSAPRDIVRFTNSLSVSWPTVAGEVYLPDFLAIELFRIFERPTYNKIRQNREFLVGSNLFADDKERAEIANDIVSDLVAKNKKDAIRMVCRMFPRIEKHTEYSTFGSSISSNLNGRPISHSLGFDGFFRFTPTDKGLSIGQIKQLRTKIEDTATLIQFLDEIDATNESLKVDLIANFLDEILDISREREKAHLQTIGAIVRRGHLIFEQSYEMKLNLFGLTNFSRFRWLLDDQIVKLTTAQKRQLDDIFDHEESHCTALATILGKITLPFGYIFEKMTDKQEVISKTHAKKLGQALSKKIEELAESNSLIDQPELWMLLASWASFGNSKHTKQWTASKLEDPVSMKKIVFSSMNRSSHDGKSRSLSMTRLPPKQIYCLPKMVSAISNNIKHKSMTEEDKMNLENFLSDVERLKSSD